MAQGKVVLSVKGMKGGEYALPSSFALSAAAFGRSSHVEVLQECGKDPPETCNFRGVAYFS